MNVSIAQPNDSRGRTNRAVGVPESALAHGVVAPGEDFVRCERKNFGFGKDRIHFFIYRFSLVISHHQEYK